MTKEELKAKLDASKEKVDKRYATIQKLCKKLNIQYEALMNSYMEKINYKDNYLPSKVAYDMVTQFAQERPTRDANGNWNDANYTFNSNLEQLGDNLVKLFEVEKVCQGWQVKYDTQKNKEDAPKIQVIWDFLTNWEAMAKDWYLKNAKRYFELKRDYEQSIESYKNSESYKKSFEREKNSTWFDRYYRTDSNLEYHLVKEFKKNYYNGIDNFTMDITNIKCKYVYPNPDNRWDYKYVPDTYTVDEAKLDKTLAQEKLAKYEDLCNRISAVVGEIQDASNLSIGAQMGEINGIVTGSKGKAKVETISAQGPIQCFHYRVLVHKIK